MKLELTDNEKRVIGEALEYMIRQFGYYELEEDKYYNDLNHCYEGDYIRDLREVAKRFIDSDVYKEISEEFEI